MNTVVDTVGISPESAPWFEDFKVGDDVSFVPAITITEGYVAIHQAMFGDRMPMAVDHDLSKIVTRGDGVLVNSALLCNIAIGQSTFASQRVLGNLFYRGLLIQQPVFIGDTLRTKTKVVALRQNKPKADRAASGMVALEIHVKNQKGQTVLLFWRCPMLPCRDPTAVTGHDDSFDMMSFELSNIEIDSVLPDWDLEAFRKTVVGPKYAQFKAGENYKLEARDTITLAPELVRLTLNMAMTHTDVKRSVYGQRLVYGGHTIAMAAAQLNRVFSNIVYIVAWYHCDHTAPVFEEDIISSSFTIENLREIESGELQGGTNGIATIHIESFAERSSQSQDAGKVFKALDWRLACLMV